MIVLNMWLLLCFFHRKVLKPVLYGQGLSLLICGTAITSKYLLQHKVDVPLTQSLINYILLGLVYTTGLSFRKTEDGENLLLKVLICILVVYTF